MNILITVVSLLSEHNYREVSYQTDFCDGPIVVKQTNLAALKCLNSMLKSKGESLDKIIAVCSFEVKEARKDFLENQTTKEYFSAQVSTILEKDDTVIPVYDFNEDKSLKNVGTLIAEICGKISHGDTIYIDTTGGQRTHTNMIQLLTKMLRYKGIKLGESFYANIQKGTGTIETTEAFTRLTDLADAVNEFATTGKSNQLSECLKNPSEKLSALLSAMGRFTDQIQLCSVKDIDKTLEDLSNALKDWEKDDSTANNEQTAVLKELLPVIREKFCLQQDGTDLKIDYSRIIEWCLQNGLVQQAVTFIVEKSIVYIYDKGAFEYNSDDERIKTKSAIDAADPSVNAFTHILMCCTPDHNERCKFKKHLQLIGRNYNNHLPLIRRNYNNHLQLIGRNYNPKYADFDKLIVLLQRRQNKSLKDRINGILHNPQNSQGIKRIAKLLISCNADDIQKLLSLISNNDKLIANILQQKEIENGFAAKFETAFNFENNSRYKAYECKVKDNRKIAEFMYGYLYAKALRNRINHASDEGNLTPAQIEVLAQHGYPISEEDLTVEKVMKNLQRILDTMQQF